MVLCASEWLGESRLPPQGCSDLAVQSSRPVWLVGGALLVVGFLIAFACVNSPGTPDRVRWLLYMGLAH